MHVKRILLVVLFIPSFIQAQDYDLPGTHAVHLEMFSVSLFSLHYEKAWFPESNRFHLLTSLGYGFSGTSRPDSEGQELAHYLPLRTHALYRFMSWKVAHHYLYGGPTTVISRYAPGHDGVPGFANASSGYNLGMALEFGYRIQAAKGGTVLRIGLTAIPEPVGNIPVSVNDFRNITVQPAISIGYAFPSKEQ